MYLFNYTITRLCSTIRYYTLVSVSYNIFFGPRRTAGRRRLAPRAPAPSRSLFLLLLLLLLMINDNSYKVLLYTFYTGVCEVQTRPTCGQYRTPSIPPNVDVHGQAQGECHRSVNKHSFLLAAIGCLPANFEMRGAGSRH